MYDGISCNDIKSWIIRGNHRVSAYGFSPSGKLVFRQKAINQNHHQVVRVCFVVNNNHCNLISPRITKSAECGRTDISGEIFNGIIGMNDREFLDYKFMGFGLINFNEHLVEGHPKVIFTDTTLHQLILKYREWTGLYPYQVNRKQQAIKVNGIIY